MIIEILNIDDASNLCHALNIPEDLAYQYHQFYQGEFVSYSKNIYDAKNRKVVNPNLAKAQFKNFRFQSLAYFYTKLIYSILSQDLDLVRYSLQDPRVDHDDRWCSPMNCACEFGQLDVVKLLVNEYGVDAFSGNHYNICCSGCVDIVKFFFSHQNANDDHYFTALIAAAEEGQPDIIRLLLADKRFDPAVHRNQGIITAAMDGNIEIVKLLLEDLRVNPADQDNQAIIIAVRKGSMEIVELLLADDRVDPSDRNNQAIIDAAWTGDVEIVQLLLDDPRVNPADQNNRAIIDACRHGNAEIVKLLLADSRVDPSDQYSQAMNSAVYNSDIEMLKILLADSRVNPAANCRYGDPRVNPGDQNNLAIIYAARRGTVEIVKLLLDSVFQPLLAACEKGDLKDIIKRLDYYSLDDLLS